MQYIDLLYCLHAESQNSMYMIPEAYVGDWEAARGNVEEGEEGLGVP